MIFITVGAVHHRRMRQAESRRRAKLTPEQRRIEDKKSLVNKENDKRFGRILALVLMILCLIMSQMANYLSHTHVEKNSKGENILVPNKQ